MIRAALLVVTAACSLPPAKHFVADPDGRGGADADDEQGEDAAVDATPPADATPDATPPITLTAIFPHTSDTLYRFDPSAMTATEVAAFRWPAGTIGEQMLNLAIDREGDLVGIGTMGIYRVDPATAVTTRLANVPPDLSGLSYVPAAQVGATGDDVLVATRMSDGAILRVDPATGAATQIGDMGHGYLGTGDLVSVAGAGTFATVSAAGSTATDTLVRLAPITFDATPIGAIGSESAVYGLAYWGDRLLGFSGTGDAVSIDPTTGSPKPIGVPGPMWFGAGVSTIAPVTP